MSQGLPSAYEVKTVDLSSYEPDRVFEIIENVSVRKVQQAQQIIQMSTKQFLSNSLTRIVDDPVYLAINRLLSQGLSSESQKPLELKYTYHSEFKPAVNDLIALTVEQKGSSSASTQHALKNSIAAAQAVSKLSKKISEQLANFKGNLGMVYEKFEYDGANQTKVLNILKQVAQLLITKLQEITVKYANLLSEISLSNAHVKLKELSNFLMVVNNHTHMFSTVGSAVMVLRDPYEDLKQETLITGLAPEEPIPGLNAKEVNTWHECLIDVHLPETVSATNLDKTINTVYDYLVGYYLSKGLCYYAKAGWFGRHFSLRQLLLNLQQTSNSQHKQFFQEVLSNLDVACTQQVNGTNKTEVCNQQMEQSRKIMSQLARLSKMLYTFTVPDEKENVVFQDVPENADALIRLLEKLKEVYLLQHVSGYEINSSIWQKIYSNLFTWKTASLLSVAGVGVAGAVTYNNYYNQPPPPPPTWSKSFRSSMGYKKPPPPSWSDSVWSAVGSASDSVSSAVGSASDSVLGAVGYKKPPPPSWSDSILSVVGRIPNVPNVYN